MAGKSKIEWCTDTWNPIVGCSVTSPGCTNCYAMSMARRIEAMQPGSHYAGTTQVVKGNPVWTGKVALAPEHILTQPLSWRRGRKIFVNSMGDLFHEDVTDEWIDCVFAVMALAPHHTFQVLTKRAARMRAYMSDPSVVRRVYELACDMAVAMRLAVVLIADPAHDKFAPPGVRIRLGLWPLPKVWLGVSAEDQRRADERVPDLLATPAAVRFVSAEPLLGQLVFRQWLSFDQPCRGCGYAGALGGAFPRRDAQCPRCGIIHTTIDWIIVGGESGPGARPMHPDWARAIRDRCATAGVPFFFKQWGEWAPPSVLFADTLANCRLQARAEANPSLVHVFPDGLNMGRIGKRSAGRLLDGREHNGMPEMRS
ncbi:phage Gp37/Gp68 family protein [Azorhizobium doebereinerae]|uniref:phage Gp37/Gp68 family protein n=1 Tax=Azorhizobium doebereinerae TaxID=281091 RepID=UPI0003F95416|nr:phage Gp37/Gp68 family protein [Azorhizobium doebereinerae]